MPAGGSRHEALWIFPCSPPRGEQAAGDAAGAAPAPACPGPSWEHPGLCPAGSAGVSPFPLPVPSWRAMCFQSLSLLSPGLSTEWINYLKAEVYL